MNTLRLAALAASIVASSAVAQSDSLRCHFDRLLSVVPAEDTAMDVAVSGNLMFVADRDAGVRIFDISDPMNPSLIGSVPVPSTRRIVHSGDIVLVGTASVGLRRISVADPTAPSSFGRVELDHSCEDVVLEGDIAYVALYDGLKIIHTPQSGPMSVISTYVPGDAAPVRFVAIRDGLAAVSHDDGVDFVDVSDPASPQLLSNAPGLTASASAALGDGYAYLSSIWINGIAVLDLSDTTAPTLVRVLGSGPASLLIEGSRLHAQRSGPGALSTYDLADPADPQLIGTALTSRSSWMHGFDVSGGKAFVAEGMAWVQDSDLGVTITSLEPQLPEPFATPSDLGGPTTYHLSRVGASPDGTIGYYRKGSQHAPPRFFVVDLTAPSGAPPLSEIGLPHTDSGSDGICVGDGFVYLTGHNQPILAIDVRDPENPVVTGETAENHDLRSLHFQNGYLYGSRSGAGVAVFDVRIPAQPEFVANVNWSGNSPIIAVTPLGGDMLVVGRREGGIEVVDSSNPPSLPVIGSSGSFLMDDVVTNGDKVFTLFKRSYGNIGARLRAFDVSDPTSPTLLSQYSWPPADTMTVGGGTFSMAGPGLMALGLNYGSINLLDVSDPADMQEIYQMSSGGSYEFAAAGTDKFIVQSDGVTVYNTALCESCPADLTGDGVLNFFDLSAYIASYNVQDPDADLAEPFGVFNFFDVAAYIDLYNAGCP